MPTGGIRRVARVVAAASSCLAEARTTAPAALPAAGACGRADPPCGLPDRAPAYFFVDIQNDQLDGFLDRARAVPGVGAVDTAPMLRGVITRINGRPAREAAGEHWALRGDRGVTYAAAPPPGTVITEGGWWREDYAGPPLMSFADEEGRELGLKLGDTMTVKNQNN